MAVESAQSDAEELGVGFCQLRNVIGDGSAFVRDKTIMHDIEKRGDDVRELLGGSHGPHATGGEH